MKYDKKSSSPEDKNPGKKATGTDGPSESEVTRATQGTAIDLGDDLLEKTAVLTRNQFQTIVQTQLQPDSQSDSASQSKSRSQSNARGEHHDRNTAISALEDELENARILLNEGFVDEAKKALHRVLLADHGNALARKRLDEIHQLELKQLLGSEITSSQRYRGRRKKGEEPTPDPDEILRALDEDLKLGDSDESASMAALLGDEQALEALSARVELEYSNASPQDRLDLGIAFLEMGIHELASRQFRNAQKHAETAMAATSLLAYSMILGGKPFEASLTLEVVLGDMEILPKNRTELVYLMGRAQEALKRYDLASQWYREALDLEQDYRDSRERLRRCENIPS